MNVIRSSIAANLASTVIDLILFYFLYRPYLEKNLKVQSERIHRQVDSVSKHVQTFFDLLQRVILVENFFATLKFAILLWVLTYVGNYLSTMAFVMLGKLITLRAHLTEHIYDK